MTCPCCGRPYDKSLGVDLGSNLLYCAGAVVQLTATEAEIAHMLVERFPRTVSVESLIWGIYGPGEQKHKNTDAIIKVMVCKLRKKVAPVGLAIKVGYTRGYRLDWVA